MTSLKHFNKLTMSVIAFFLSATCVFAEPAEDPEKIIEKLFWGNLYVKGGNTFYCNEPFKSKSPLLAASHVYSGSWVRDNLRCGTKRQCERESEDYKRIMADLHNVVPADSYFDFKRKNALFGTLDQALKPNKCGIRKKFQVIEPPNRIKGDIARIMFYMNKRYQLPLMTNVPELKRWHELDPPDAAEQARNRAIAALQGESNPYIDDPKLADSL
ncbi:MAG: endonuclease [Oleiphilaceae bacterium]|nr:endonuclease [Oleiphilaceae bacterium]